MAENSKLIYDGPQTDEEAKADAANGAVICAWLLKRAKECTNPDQIERLGFLMAEYFRIRKFGAGPLNLSEPPSALR